MSAGSRQAQYDPAFRLTVLSTHRLTAPAYLDAFSACDRSETLFSWLAEQQTREPPA
jgi:hypothetical protein